VKFIIFYGSLATGKVRRKSDIDICIYYEAKKREELSRFRLKVLKNLGSEIYDVQIFQLLPLWIRKEVLRGKILYAPDKRFLYESALATVREFDAFAPHYRDYIYHRSAIRKDMILIKIKEIEENVKIVENALPKNLAEFLALGLVKDGIYKKIEFVIQNVLDICSIINADLELGLPTEEEDIVNNLIKENILTKKLGKKVREMRGFRNFLVHRYGKVDGNVAFENIKKGLLDFRKFNSEIKNWLKGQK
jgi:uncharacterized protein YutE (UPF0331/DUF86 family)/predicted nucleotidyltransferase